MKVALLKDMKGLGQAGDTLDVSDGYARNYLIPRRLAVLFDSQTAKTLAEKRQNIEDAASRSREIAQKLIESLARRKYEFVLPADAKGSLYKGLKESEISAKIRKGEASLKPDLLKFPDFQPLKSVGEHKVGLQIGDKAVEIKVIIHPVK